MNKKLAKKLYDELVELTCKIATIPSPTFDEAEKRKFIDEYLNNINCRHYIDEVGNIIVPSRRKDKVVFVAHYDTVFPKDTNLTIKKDGNFLCCPSIGDNSVNVAALLIMIKNLMFSDAIELVFTVGEEGLGNLYGMKHYMSSQTYIKEMIAVDLGYKTIAYDCVGSTRYQVSIKTKGGHSWGDFGNPNAIIIASSIINELTKLELCNVENSKTTYNVGVIEGGTTVNTIAEKCKFLFEYRSDNDFCLNTMNEKFKELLKKYRHATYQIIGERPSSKNIKAEEQKVLVDKVSNIIESVTMEKPKLEKLSMDFNVAMNMGIPCTSIGVCDSTNAHSLEEKIDSNSLLTGLEILIDLMLSYK